MFKEKGKRHWWPENGPPGRKKGYPKTACGRDGSDVGGLITAFFRMNKDRLDNCKTCEHIYQMYLSGIRRNKDA